MLGCTYHVHESMIALLPDRDDFPSLGESFLDAVQTWMDDASRWGVGALDTVLPGADLMLVVGRNFCSATMPPMNRVLSLLREQLPTNSVHGLSLGSPVLDDLERDPQMVACLSGVVEHQSQSLAHLHIASYPQSLSSVFLTLRLVLPRAPALVRVETYHKQTPLRDEYSVTSFLDSLARDAFTLMAAHCPLIRDFCFNIDLKGSKKELYWPCEHALTHHTKETQRSVRLVMQRLQSYAGLPPTVQCWSEFYSLAKSLETDHDYLGLSLGTFLFQGFTQGISITEEAMAVALARAEEWVEQLRAMGGGSMDEKHLDLFRGWDTGIRASQHAEEGVQGCKRLIALRRQFIDALVGRRFDVKWSASVNALRWSPPTYGLKRIQHVHVRTCATLRSLSNCLYALGQLSPGLITVWVDVKNLAKEKERGTALSVADSLLALAKRHGRTLVELGLEHHDSLNTLTADVWVDIVTHCPRLRRLDHGIVYMGSTTKHYSLSMAMRQFVRSVARASPWLADINGSFYHDNYLVACNAITNSLHTDSWILSMLPRLRGFYEVNVDFYRGLCY